MEGETGGLLTGDCSWESSLPSESRPAAGASDRGRSQNPKTPLYEKMITKPAIIAATDSMIKTVCLKNRSRISSGEYFWEIRPLRANSKASGR